MKNLSKIIAAAGLLMLAFAIIFSCSTPNTAEGKRFTPGKYPVTISGHGGDIEFEVEMSETGITAITVISESETDGLGKPALEKMASKIIAEQSLDVDAVTGASDSSDAVKEAVMIALEKAGGSAADLRPSARENSLQNEEITADVVVVGGGASGTAAALAAAEKGANVVVLEKASTPGGAGRFFAEGLLAFESSQQKDLGIKYTVEQAFKFLAEYTHLKNNGDLTRTILAESASTIDWMAKYGAETKLIPNTQKAHVNDPATYHKYVDKHQAYDTMYSKFENMGGKLYTDAAGKKLIIENGKVTGIIAEKADGSELTVRAESVILATGGFGGNDEMIRKYMNVTDYATLAYANNVGDGFNMAVEAGADEFNPGIAVHSALIPVKDPKIWQGTAGQLHNLPLMWINREGKRFVDESAVYDFALWGNAVVTQGGVYYTVVDETTMKLLSTEGSPLTNSFERTYLVGANVDTNLASGVVAPLENLYESMEATIQAGGAFKADTLEELAAAIDVDPENLKASAASYTEAVRTGNDTKFFKDEEYLKYGVSEGPFYAIKAAALVENSIGGVRVNSDLEVLTDEMKAIPGLFAVGCDAGSLYGDSYPVYEGLCLSFAFNSGRLAGYKAAEQ